MLYVIAAGGSGTKPVGKGVDLDAVGNINGVPVYEFDLDGLKVEDKPWRKPGMPCFLHDVCNYIWRYIFVEFLFFFAFIVLIICLAHEGWFCVVMLKVLI